MFSLGISAWIRIRWEIWCLPYTGFFRGKLFWLKSCSCKNKMSFFHVSSLQVITFIAGSLYSNSSCLKKWHFLDLVYSARVVTITTGLNYSKRKALTVEFSGHSMCIISCNNERKFSCQISSPQKWHFLDLVCSVHLVIITFWLSFSKRSRLKSGIFLT